MSIRWLAPALALTVLSSPAVTFADEANAQLERGIVLVQRGEYAEAIIILDGVARTLAQEPREQREAARAYLHLGIAYVGEGQEALAKASFREAATRDSELVLTAFDVSPKVRELFQQAKDELARESAVARASAPEKKGGSKLPWIIVGVLGAGGAAAAVASSGSGDGEPQGFASDAWLNIRLFDTSRVPLVGLEVQFDSESFAVDADRWSWDFGDGSTSNESFVARHTYMAPGSYQVVVTATRGADTLRSELTVEVRSLTGIWDGQSEHGQSFSVQMTQNGTNLSGNVDGLSIDGAVGLDYWVRFGTACGTRFDGELSGDARQVDGLGSLPCRRNVERQVLYQR